MELRRLTMVNWHLFDAEDIEVRGNFGVLGENRSGKSTILDMVQVVLSGASRTYLRLNAVAGEGSKGRSSSKRSVLGYCLGTLGDGEIRRPDALTYVALGFEDPEGLRPHVTIGLALEARSTDSSETVLGRFVVTGKSLTTADFTEEKDDAQYAASWDDVKARIVGEVGATNFINHRENPLGNAAKHRLRGGTAGAAIRRHRSVSRGRVRRCVGQRAAEGHVTGTVRRGVLENGWQEPEGHDGLLRGSGT